MFDIEYVLRKSDLCITREQRRSMVVKRFFCRRGLYMQNYNWILLYKAIRDFKLIFRFKYNLISKTLTGDYIPRGLRWLNQMRFFQFYLKLSKRFKWHQIPLKNLFLYINKAKRGCYLGLIKQKKKIKK